ncbi:MAG: hypothetical protein GXZ14_02790 [Ruminococcaceae bacterium]|nr:hypothetical protein [Oscillospiraceae bacterium]
MPDYKEMYLKLFRASEQAASTLIAAQRECEEMYLNQPEPILKVISKPQENNKSMDKE